MDEVALGFGGGEEAIDTIGVEDVGGVGVVLEALGHFASVGGGDAGGKCLGFAQSGSSSAKGRFSNDWKKSFQWLENFERFFPTIGKIFWETKETKWASKDEGNKIVRQL